MRQKYRGGTQIKSLHKENRVCFVAVTNVFLCSTQEVEHKKHFYITFLFSADLKLMVNRERSVPFGCIWSFYKSNAAGLTENGARVKQELDFTDFFPSLFQNHNTTAQL